MEQPELVQSLDLPSTSSLLTRRAACNQKGSTKAKGVSLEEAGSDGSEVTTTSSSTSLVGGNMPDSKVASLDSTGMELEEINKGNERESKDESLYDCNICLDTAKDAVVTMCGHLYCWPCLHQWLLTRPNNKVCPVCKSSINKDKVIPLYGRNSARRDDPRNRVPPRPAGQRTEPEAGYPNFGFGDGFFMFFGIGGFPFGLLTSSINIRERRPPVPGRYRGRNNGQTRNEDEQTLSRMFLYLAFILIAWLLFA
ncbi:uncharacterized protein Dana_GF19745 [Drosophila ananassae]|uniref:RING-type E3 ubiquitin transferase n=1 Tax=Drosophila ananassae TaxID=7217 RepID=B3N1Q8_DROAN|nr:E3 ubiquitin-protein ligase RNF185 [Drosophila ananassae]EDV34027.1 uncharacterized protein Dana_GF19745 [Drosophila ananassae]